MSGGESTELPLGAAPGVDSADASITDSALGGTSQATNSVGAEAEAPPPYDHAFLTPEPPGTRLITGSDSETGNETSGTETGNETETPQRKAGLSDIFRLFRFANCNDWLLMLVGTVTAIAHGTALPIAMWVFGLLTNVFVNFFSSQQLANTELTFTPADFANEVALLNIDLDILRSGFINFTNFSGGVVNCSEDFELLPNGNNFDELLKVGVTQLASCLDADSFNEEVLIYIWAFLGIAAGVFFLAYFQITTFQLACERQVYKIQLAFYRAILRQNIGWFDATPTGELSSRLADDIEKIHDGIGDKLAIFIQWISTFFTGFIIGFVIEWRLTLLLLGVMPFLAMSGAVFSWLTAAAASREQQQYASAGAVAEEVLSSIRTVVAFGGEYKEARRYHHRLIDARNTGFLKGVVGGLSLGIIFFFIFSCYAGAFWFGAWLISKEIVQAGEVLTVFFAVLIAAFSIGKAIPNLEKLVTSAGASVTIYNIIDRVPPIDSSSSQGEVPEMFNSTIDFKDVTFSYPTRPTVPVLQGFDVYVGAGQTVALVGHSGCGKSTAVQLLLRFYDVSAGQILIGGHDIRQLNLRWLREHIGVVSQEPVLFDTTIADNIRFGFQAATAEDIERAAQKANAHEFISRLPLGYETLVGERGTQLSGGQKQRIAIARALVRDPKILLLDEATSALDSASEAIVQAALDRAREGRTTVVIAHRLSTVQNADMIVAMADGRVVETGTHSQLLARKGLYHDLVTAQMQPDFDNAILSPRRKPSVGGGWAKHAESSPTPEDHDVPSKTDKLEETAEKKQKKRVSAKQQELWDKELPDVPWIEILQLNLKHWWEFIIITLGLVGATVQGAIFPSFALFFGEVLVVFTLPSERVLGETHLWAGLFVMLGVISAVAQFFKVFCFTVTGEILTCRLRSNAFRALLRQEVAWFDDERHSTGTLTAQLANDAGQVQGATGAHLGTLFETLVGLVVALIIAFTASWVLSLAVLGLVPFVVFAGFLQLKVLTGFASSYKKAVEDAGKIAVDSIDNMRTVAALSAEDTFFNLYQQEVQSPYLHGLFDSQHSCLYTVRKSLLFSSSVSGLAYGFSQAILFVGYVVTFRFGAYLITRPVNHLLYLRFEELFKVFIALIFGALAIGQAGAFAPSYAKAKLSAQRIFALLHRQPVIDNYSEEGTEILNPTGELAITDAEFSYPARPSVRVLQGLSLRVRPGQTLALVGASGCGKSTVVSLIERFYDPQHGLLSLDSIDIKSLNIRWLRSQLGIVFQEPVLFDTTIAANIRYGANFREVSDEEVLAAAEAANIHQFIESLPQGYYTNVGGKGTQLSGGQKQRIAIARALVRDPKVLMLDEATSALDAESEKVVQAALDKARVGRTCIVIAHRLSTVYNADCIAVIHEGRVVEMGTHAELIALGGIYYKLNSHQLLATS